MRPSGLKATELTPLIECPVRVAISRRVATSHSLMVLSALPEAKILPSRLNASELTSVYLNVVECPSNVAILLPVAISHTWMVPSKLPLPEAKVLPSGLKAIE